MYITIYNYNREIQELLKLCARTRTHARTHACTYARTHARTHMKIS